MLSIYDPLHGSIEVSPAEIKLIDSRPLQRLRSIKQMGFADMAFPGATHTRYAHSLGAMHMASRMADRLFSLLDIPPLDKERYKQMLRLAVLFHDLGHPPLSHTLEYLMPPVSALNLPAPLVDNPTRPATHEDYTLKILLDSELRELLEQTFSAQDISVSHLISILRTPLSPDDLQTFQIADKNLLKLLKQVVSSELDADRMDYLERDAYYSGVTYGHFDHQWLTNHLLPVAQNGELCLGLAHKAVWAFENFLLARYHMFLSVYYHHTPLAFEYLLRKYLKDTTYSLPTSIDDYLNTDDISLFSALRNSSHPLAKRLLNRQTAKLLLETHEYGEEPNFTALEERLQEAKIDFFKVHSNTVLSKYVNQQQDTKVLLVIEPERHKISDVAAYTPLYKRFNEVAKISRIYCEPQDLERARKLI